MKKQPFALWSRLARFVRITVLGGVAVLLPILLSFLLLRWLYRTGVALIQPITRTLIETAALQELAAQTVAVVLVVAVCFLTGLVVRTRLGSWVLESMENYLSRIAPGYTLFKETLKQLLGSGKRPFSGVVLGRVFGGNTLMTGFITDEYTPAGRVTVFFPSALNPTTGLLCHLQEEDVWRLNVSVETAMRTIISCGGGSSDLLKTMAGNVEQTGLESRRK
jgi:uncharacterized membrane protein